MKDKAHIIPIVISSMLIIAFILFVCTQPHWDIAERPELHLGDHIIGIVAYVIFFTATGIAVTAYKRKRKKQ